MPRKNFNIHKIEGENDEYSTIPTLSDLIEACGDGIYKLCRVVNAEDIAGWTACGNWVGLGSINGTASTPEEAVAKLWLEIHGGN